MTTRLSDTTSPDVPARPTVLVPLGSTEQHGPHLPLDTDTVVATAVAAGVAERLDAPVVLAPALAYGSAGEHQDFAGTVSIGADALRVVLVELVRSLGTWAGRVVLVNGHGGNVPIVASAVRQMVEEGHDVAWVPCAVPDADAHAGLTETSLLLHLRPGSVATERAEPGETRPLAEILPALRSGGTRAVSANGVLGDPTGASAAYGARVLSAMVDAAVARLAGP